MNGVSYHFLACAAFTTQKDRGIRAGNLSNMVIDLPHRTGVSDQIAEIVFLFKLLFEMRILFQQFPALFTLEVFYAQGSSDYSRGNFDQFNYFRVSACIGILEGERYRSHRAAGKEER